MQYIYMMRDKFVAFSAVGEERDHEAFWERGGEVLSQKAFFAKTFGQRYKRVDKVMCAGLWSI